MNAVAQKIKGPAKAATFPSRGSTNPQKVMEMNRTKDSTADAVTASETRSVGDAVDILCRAISINHLIFEAAHRLEDQAIVNAFVEGNLVIDEFLKDAKAILYASLERKGAQA